MRMMQRTHRLGLGLTSILRPACARKHPSRQHAPLRLALALALADHPVPLRPAGRPRRCRPQVPLWCVEWAQQPRKGTHRPGRRGPFRLAAQRHLTRRQQRTNDGPLLRRHRHHLMRRPHRHPSPVVAALGLEQEKPGEEEYARLPPEEEKQQHQPQATIPIRLLMLDVARRRTPRQMGTPPVDPPHDVAAGSSRLQGTRWPTMISVAVSMMMWLATRSRCTEIRQRRINGEGARLDMTKISSPRAPRSSNSRRKRRQRFGGRPRSRCPQRRTTWIW